MLFKTIFEKWEDARDLTRRTRRTRREVFGYAPLDQETREVQGSSLFTLRRTLRRTFVVDESFCMELSTINITRSITYHGTMGGLDHT